MSDVSLVDMIGLTTRGNNFVASTTPVSEGNSVGLCDRTACWSEVLCDGLRASGKSSALLRRLYLTTVDW